MKKALLALAVGGIALMAYAGAGEAAEQRSKATASGGASTQPKVRHYRKRAAQVRGYYFGRRIGGYSYSAEDVINTYGLTRNLYGSTNSYRDPFTDRQTASGPFDSGFFFDSGIAPRGGDSPYQH